MCPQLSALCSAACGFRDHCRCTVPKKVKIFAQKPSLTLLKQTCSDIGNGCV